LSTIGDSAGRAAGVRRAGAGFRFGREVFLLFVIFCAARAGFLRRGAAFFFPEPFLVFDFVFVFAFVRRFLAIRKPPNCSRAVF
jgi:hypothetical protein